MVLVGAATAGATGLDEYFDQYSSEQATDAEESRMVTPAFVPTLTRADALLLPNGPGILDDTHLSEFLTAIEADRRLLNELRKPVPETRQDAIVFLNRLKDLAEEADPIRLAMVADRVLEQAPIYFDWLETEFETEQDRLYDYYIGGAQGFNRVLLEFENAVLFTVVNRLDTASRIIQESNSVEQ